jgi:hypothetical protein
MAQSPDGYALQLIRLRFLKTTDFLELFLSPVPLSMRQDGPNKINEDLFLTIIVPERQSA